MAAKRLCSVPDCGKPHNARGLCAMHLRRLKIHGDPHVTLRPGPKGRIAPFLQFVEGYDGADCLFWPFDRSDRGRAIATIDGRNTFVHRYVCERANGPPPSAKHITAHSCGNGHLGCVNPKHLRWATTKENHADRLAHGTHGYKLSATDIVQIRLLYESHTGKEVAKLFGIHPETVFKIASRQMWAIVP